MPDRCTTRCTDIPNSKLSTTWHFNIFALELYGARQVATVVGYRRPADLSCYESPSPGVLSLYPSEARCSARLVQGALVANTERQKRKCKGALVANIERAAGLLYWVDRTQKRTDCADLLRTDRSQFNPGTMVATVVGRNSVASVLFVETHATRRVDTSTWPQRVRIRRKITEKESFKTRPNRALAFFSGKSEVSSMRETKKFHFL